MPSFPTKSLAAHRADLVEVLDQKYSAKGEINVWTRFLSLASRITAVGHLSNEGTYPVGIEFPASVEYGVKRRETLARGNKRWTPSTKGQYKNPYINLKEPEPHALVRKQMKIKFADGVNRANKYANELGHDFIYKPATSYIQEDWQHPSIIRTPSGAFGREEVVEALITLRNSFPIEYDHAATADHWNEIKRVNKKVRAAQVSTPKSSPTTPPPQSPIHRLSRLSNDSHLSFTSFASADTFGAGVKKVKTKAGRVATALRKAASFVPGFRRLAGKADVREEEYDPYRYPESEEDDGGLQRHLDRVGDWIGDAHRDTPVLQEQEQEQEQPFEAPITPTNSSHHTSKRSSKEFSIDAGIVSPVTAPVAAAKEFFIDGGIVLASPKSPIEKLYEHVAASVEHLPTTDSPGEQDIQPTVDELSCEPPPRPTQARLSCNTPTQTAAADAVATQVPQPFVLQHPDSAIVRRRRRDRGRGRYTFGAKLV